jgi:hypothetical protein
VRGGYGIYYAPVIYNDFGNTGVLGYSPGAVNINGGLDAFITLDNYPFGSHRQSERSSCPVNSIGLTWTSSTRTSRQGAPCNTALDLQRQLPWNLAVQVSYIGKQGHAAAFKLDPNQQGTAQCSQTRPTVALETVGGRDSFGPQLRGSPGLSAGHGGKSTVSGLL